MAGHLRSLQNELDMASVDVEDKYQVIGISLETVSYPYHKLSGHH